MATLQAEFKRAALRSLYRQNAGALTLRLALEAFQDRLFNSVQTGKVVSASAGAGYSTTFALPSALSQLGPDILTGFSEELIGIYDDAKTTLAAGGNDSPDDDTILGTMLADNRLQTVTESYGDYSMLRVASMGGGA